MICFGIILQKVMNFLRPTIKHFRMGERNGCQKHADMAHGFAQYIATRPKLHSNPNPKP